MKYIPPADRNGVATVELTRRNLETLLAKLDDPNSRRALVKHAYDPVHRHAAVVVSAVEDEAHYSDRAPGEVRMPSTGSSEVPTYRGRTWNKADC